MEPSNASIQSSAIDLLQAIVARGEIDTIVEDVEAIVVRKLYFCIHSSRLDLQNKLLHLLHSVISASMAQDESRQANKEKPDGSAPGSAIGHDSDPAARSYSVNSLLVQTLIDGIAVRTNRPVLQHWLDFLLMAIPQFQHALQAVVGLSTTAYAANCLLLCGTSSMHHHKDSVTRKTCYPLQQMQK